MEIFTLTFPKTAVSAIPEFTDLAISFGACSFFTVNSCHVGFTVFFAVLEGTVKTNFTEASIVILTRACYYFCI